jgi:hypothetical protein
MNPFHVWLRPVGGACKVRVDGTRNAKWLLDRLSRSFIFKSCEPLSEEQGSSCCSFRVAYNSQVSRPAFERLLAAIPEVKLMLDPA